MKKFVAVLLTLAMVCVPLTQAKAEGTSYSASVRCSCCSDMARVSHRYDYNSASDITTRSYVYDGQIEELEQWIHIDGRCGSEYGSDIMIGYNAELNVTYYWGDHYDIFAERAMPEFYIRKGENWKATTGYWQN